MITFFWIMICVLMALLVAGLVRIARGPTLSDRISATLLLGTTGTSMLLLMHVVLDMPALVDAALVLVLLAVVSSVAFSRYTQSREASASKGTSHVV